MNAARAALWTLHVPVTFHLHGHPAQSGCSASMALTQSVREAMRHSVLLEICGLDAGVPPSRLVDVVGMIRSLCVGVIGRVRPSRAALNAVRGCGLREAGGGEPSFWRPQQPDLSVQMKAFSAAVAKDISPNLLIHGLPDAKLVDVAGKSGYSHASVTAQPE